MFGLNGSRTIPSEDFYGEYHGHQVSHLSTLFNALHDSRRVIWFAGDSSLDNKYWLPERVEPTNGYERVLRPAISRPDVCYHLNTLVDRSTVAINTAVEASLLRQRSESKLLPQDEFLRDHIKKEDVLVVSVGGNDIALLPSSSTAENLPLAVEELNSSDCDTLSKGPGMSYFIELCGEQVKLYVEQLVSNHKPALVIVCMIYYPDETATGSWADAVLEKMGYDIDPKKVQAFISQLFEHATSKISIPGTKVVPLPLFEVLDGRTSSQYVERVEPSNEGGRLMANQIWESVKLHAAPTLSFPNTSNVDL
mmetsp:Transcript_26517/g.39370  ORF Transcript_26517/g.39370 Transcript_26517/m.39370 type:complete len:309 (-) Transcript_26517:2151-3077(-)